MAANPDVAGGGSLTFTGTDIGGIGRAVTRRLVTPLASA